MMLQGRTPAGRHGRAAAICIVASAVAAVALSKLAFVPSPGCSSSGAGRQCGAGKGGARLPDGSGVPGAVNAGDKVDGGHATMSPGVVAMLLATAAGVGASAARQSLRKGQGFSPAQSKARIGGGVARRQAAPSGVDWTGTKTPWSDIEEKPLWEALDWGNIHVVLTVSSLLLFAFQCTRILAHQAPSQLEVWITTALYLPWIAATWRDTEKLEEHYRVTFYASCGWGIMSLASLHSVVYQGAFPDLSFGILAAGNVVFFASCVYFYGYHWARMWRHFTQNRFRPLWIPGLVGLMALHALTVADFAKRIDDGKWWPVVCNVYPDEWWWVADVRIIELFVTAAALVFIMLHIKGVFTGMKNAFVVVFTTIFAPVLLMVAETYWLRASAWQHYLMLGPKHW